MRCFVPGCLNDIVNWTEDDIITYHRFPSDPQLRDLWIRSLGIYDSEPGMCSVVCSDHFPQGAFYCNDKGFLRVKEDVLPSVNLDRESELQAKKKSVERKRKIAEVYQEMVPTSISEIPLPNEIVNTESQPKDRPKNNVRGKNPVKHAK